MKSIYITRNITLQRTGHDDVVLPKGHHTVADDVAEHPFVKHHVASVEDAGEDVADLQALLDQTRIAAASEIEQLQLTLKNAQSSGDEWRRKFDHQGSALAQLQEDVERHGNVARIAADDLRKAHQDLAAALTTVAERDATIAAYAAMTPAAEAKGKAK